MNMGVVEWRVSSPCLVVHLQSKADEEPGRVIAQGYYVPTMST